MILFDIISIILFISQIFNRIIPYDLISHDPTDDQKRSHNSNDGKKKYIKSDLCPVHIFCEPFV